jgi:predicted amidohydrolase
MTTPYIPTTAYIRVATACPVVSVADVAQNLQEITHLYDAAVATGVALSGIPRISHHGLLTRRFGAT